MSKPLTSRRRPKLRVVGSAREHVRHVQLFTHISGDQLIAEFWTEAEFNALAPWERPRTPARVPGLGWMELRKSTDADEIADVTDVIQQFHEIDAAMRGDG